MNGIWQVFSHPDSTLTAWPDNRITEDAHYVYRYDEYGRLAEKTDRIPEGVIRMHDERTHHYHYDSQHRLVFYTRIQHGEPQVESRYLYDLKFKLTITRLDMARTMTVALGDELWEYIESLIESGDYRTQSEVIRESLRLLREKQAESRLQVSCGIYWQKA